MQHNRAAGVLLHPASLPGSPGIGEIGKNAYRFIDFLEASGASLWQILPLGPTGHGNSPYTALSSFAGNPLLIALDTLEEQGLLSPGTVSGHPPFSPGHIDYDTLVSWKDPIVREAAVHFLQDMTDSAATDYAEFCGTEAYWLDDYALFISAKRYFDAKAASEGVKDSRWNSFWPKNLASREDEALDHWREKFREEIEVEKVLQYFFHVQWKEVKRYANRRGIQIFGDIPIFAAPDSADLWSRPELFRLDKHNSPEVVSGVPPDYFSSTGQRWGNPLYNWEVHRQENFSWWISRLRKTFEMVDIVRIDHFRGFHAYWEIPADSPVATEGRWVKAPGREFFSALHKEMGDLPIVAENLGVITPEVEALRREFDLPGMLVFHFAFDPDGEGGLNTDNPFLSYNHSRDAVAYTGTHDNDTTLGWYSSRSEEEKDLIRRFLGSSDEDIVWELIREVYKSVARYAVIPLQDPLELGSEARINTPSTVGENWSWRVREEQLSDSVAERLLDYARLYGRLPGSR